MESIEMYDVTIMNERLKRLNKASNDGDINELNQLMEEDPSLLDKFDHVVPERARDNPLHIAASNGHVDYTMEVLRLKPQLAEMRNREGQLPLHLAIARGHIEVVEKLLDHTNGRKFHLRPESKYGYMAAHIAAINGEHTIMKMLVEGCKHVLNETTPRHETLLHLAVVANCFDSVCYLIKKGINLNEKNVDGNTCLHLACQKRNHQVITYLLDQEGMEVNSTNARGLTPLDVLLVTSWDSVTDVSLVDILRRAGGQGATELGNLQSNFSNSRYIFSYRNKHMVKAQNDAQILLVVATLVAAMTYPAILNPPGGFIQLPFDKEDAWRPFGEDDVQSKLNTTFYKNWIYTDSFPSGRPVLLWQLNTFFILNSMALFSSISVILILLCGIPQTKIMMKLLVGVLWLAVFCTALAFASAFLLYYVPFSFLYDIIIEEYFSSTLWVSELVIAWSVVFAIAGFWASYQVIRFLWKKGGFKGKLPNWIRKVQCPKNERFRKTTSIICMVCFLGIICLTVYELWRSVTYYLY
ncbi:Ankyrin repeat-containing protein, partial [Rhynchospora pubera]